MYRVIELDKTPQVVEVEVDKIQRIIVREREVDRVAEREEDRHKVEDKLDTEEKGEIITITLSTEVEQNAVIIQVTRHPIIREKKAITKIHVIIKIDQVNLSQKILVGKKLMALAIETTITGYQRYIDVAQHVYRQLPVVDQVGIVIRDDIQKQDVVTVIDLIIDGEGQWVEVEEGVQ